MDFKKIFKKVGGLLLEVAPTATAAIGLPGVGNLAIKTISEAVLGRDDGNANEIEKALIENKSPEVLLKLREADYAFKAKMAEGEIDIQRIRLEQDKLDEQSTEGARKMFAINMWPQTIFSAMFICCYFAVLIIFMRMMFAGQDITSEWVKGTFGTIFGVMTGSIPVILHFWFGSTKGSSDKNNIMSERMK